ncbi:PE family protein, partial [Mycobacterium canetti]|uniref:PE family protein n=1 Tax=Mycobacterium canetti TaxID=78331 RepID=UPI0032E505A4
MVMSLMVAPELVAAAAADLTGIGSAISAANAAAAGPTTQVLAAAGDEVSAAIAALFSAHAQEYRLLSAQVATFHEQFVRSLTAAGGAYASAEAANASLQTLEQEVLGAINAPTQLLFGRPLIGDGVNGAPGTGQAGGAGGLLWGNGGNGGFGGGGEVGGGGGGGRGGWAGG